MENETENGPTNLWNAYNIRWIIEIEDHHFLKLNSFVDLILYKIYYLKTYYFLRKKWKTSNCTIFLWVRNRDVGLRYGSIILSFEKY